MKIKHYPIKISKKKKRKVNKNYKQKKNNKIINK